MDQEDYEKEKEKNKEMKHELLVLKSKYEEQSKVLNNQLS